MQISTIPETCAVAVRPALSVPIALIVTDPTGSDTPFASKSHQQMASGVPHRRPGEPPLKTRASMPSTLTSGALPPLNGWTTRIRPRTVTIFGGNVEDSGPPRTKPSAGEVIERVGSVPPFRTVTSMLSVPTPPWGSTARAVSVLSPRATGTDAVNGAVPVAGTPLTETSADGSSSVPVTLTGLVK